MLSLASLARRTAAALAVALLATTPAPVTAQAAQAAKPALNDATIVAIFDLANTADIQTGSLAVRRAHNKEVRDLGQSFAAAHTQVRQLGRDLAAKLGVTVPALPADFPMAVDHAAAMKQLEGLQGAAFDRAFLAHEAAYHAAVIDAINKTLLPAIQNEELKQLVLQVTPAFDSHLKAVRDLQRRLGYTSGS